MRNELNRVVEDFSYIHLNIPSGYLRISITPNCNMQCSYCHNEGQIASKTSFMTIEQLRYIVTNAQRYGLVKVRLTGGEPLVHPQCYEMLHMLRHELNVPSIGLNTNGILIDRLLPIVKDKLCDTIGVGVDFVDCNISKDSPIGVSSKTILENILTMKSLGQDVTIACVFNNDPSDIERIEKLSSWCIEHDVVLKILEVSDTKINAKIDEKFLSMIEYIVDRFNMKLGMIKTFSEYYGSLNGKPSIYFFHSHCRLRECDICARIHIRVTSDGYIKSCILNDIKYPLLSSDFDDSMLTVIHNLGNPPEYWA